MFIRYFAPDILHHAHLQNKVTYKFSNFQTF